MDMCKLALVRYLQQHFKTTANCLTSLISEHPMVSYPATIAFLLIAFSLISVFVLFVTWQNEWLDHVRCTLRASENRLERASANGFEQLLPRAMRRASERPGVDIRISPPANSPASSSGWLYGRAAVENDGVEGAASQAAAEDDEGARRQ